MKDVIQKKLKSALAEMRKATGLSQSAVAKKMGTTQEYACKMEGSGPVSLEKAVDWAKACGFTAKVVFKNAEATIVKKISR